MKSVIKEIGSIFIPVKILRNQLNGMREFWSLSLQLIGLRVLKGVGRRGYTNVIRKFVKINK
jgi:hypothetical protein